MRENAEDGRRFDSEKEKRKRSGSCKNMRGTTNGQTRWRKTKKEIKRKL